MTTVFFYLFKGGKYDLKPESAVRCCQEMVKGVRHYNCAGQKNIAWADLKYGHCNVWVRAFMPKSFRSDMILSHLFNDSLP